MAYSGWRLIALVSTRLNRRDYANWQLPE